MKLPAATALHSQRSVSLLTQWLPDPANRRLQVKARPIHGFIWWARIGTGLGLLALVGLASGATGTWWMWGLLAGLPALALLYGRFTLGRPYPGRSSTGREPASCSGSWPCVCWRTGSR